MDAPTRRSAQRYGTLKQEESEFRMINVEFSGDILTASSPSMLRSWQLRAGALSARSLITYDADPKGRDWITARGVLDDAALGPSIVPPNGIPLAPFRVEFSSSEERELPVHAPVSRGALSVTGADGFGYRVHVSVFHDSGAIICSLEQFGTRMVEVDQASSTPEAAPTGVEVDKSAVETSSANNRDVLEAFSYAGQHWELVIVDLLDQTDIHDTLTFERRFRLCNIQSIAEMTCLLALEDPLTNEGLLLVKLAPLPHARPIKTLDVKSKGTWLHWLGHGFAGDGQGYRWAVLGYSGGRLGRARRLHALQRSLRVPRPERDGLLLSNTWGDRNRDTRINDAFICTEMAAGAELGVDVCEIDDGWERGVTSNSARAREKHGIWEGFWAADARYWEPRTTTFSDGMKPLISASKSHGIGLGLWFAPDSSNDFANWGKDAQVCLGMWRDWGVSHIKLDGIKLRSQLSAENLHRFFNAVLIESQGDIIFDLDITAETRPGYFGAIEVGQLFLENRYTDWTRYFPHAVLRNIWMLSFYVAPQRLRMEFLNPSRNQELYGNDPLAPGRYPPETLFAIVMTTAPLAFFEVSELPDYVISALKPLISIWREHRAELQRGTILPIGDCPSGASFTGFCSDLGDLAHVLVYRELTQLPTANLELPLEGTWEIDRCIAGGGEAWLQRGSSAAAEVTIKIHLPEPLTFIWLRLKRC